MIFFIIYILYFYLFLLNCSNHAEITSAHKVKDKYMINKDLFQMESINLQKMYPFCAKVTHMTKKKPVCSKTAFKRCFRRKTIPQDFLVFIEIKHSGNCMYREFYKVVKRNIEKTRMGFIHFLSFTYPVGQIQLHVCIVCMQIHS